MTDGSNSESATDGSNEDAPAPRPRSAASRARRIGGAAAVPRPTTAATQDPAPATEPAEPAAPSEPENPGDAVDLAKPQTPTPDSDGRPGRRGGRSLPAWSVWAPAIALAATAVVFLTLFLVDRVGSDDAPGRSQATRVKVLAAAKTCLATLNTYRYDQLSSYTAAGVKCTTGQLTKDFRQAATTLIGKNAPTLQSVQQAKITTAGIESVTDDGKQWTVLAYGTLAITTKTQKQGRNDPFAVVARLQQVGGSWRLAKIDTVSSINS